MTDREERLKEIAQREAKATAGPWTHQIWTTPHSCRVPACALHVVDGPPPSLSFEDAQFIAHARDDVPWLLSEVRTLAASQQREAALAQQLAEKQSLIQELRRVSGRGGAVCESHGKAVLVSHLDGDPCSDFYIRPGTGAPPVDDLRVRSYWCHNCGRMKRWTGPKEPPCTACGHDQSAAARVPDAETARPENAHG